MLRFWPSLVHVLVWMAILTVTGRAVARALPGRTRTFAELFLAPALGFSVFVIVATAIGWICGFPSGLTLAVTAGIFALSCHLERDWPAARRQLAGHSIVVIVVSTGVLLPVLRYGGYNVFNDTFTYLVHAQWLQSHAFGSPVVADLFQPAYSQVSLYQALGLRMGASFFLGWVQSASPLGWSIQTYPVVMAVVVSTGALSVGGLAAALAGGRRKLAILWSLVAGTSIGGFCK